jgi:hypothetical protein
MTVIRRSVHGTVSLRVQLLVAWTTSDNYQKKKLDPPRRMRNFVVVVVVVVVIVVGDLLCFCTRFPFLKYIVLVIRDFSLTYDT